MLWKKFETYLTVEKNYSPNSLAAYRTDIHDFRDYLLKREIDLFEEEEVNKIKHRDIRAWMGKLIARDLSYRSVARKVTVAEPVAPQSSVNIVKLRVQVTDEQSSTAVAPASI